MCISVVSVGTYGVAFNWSLPPGSMGDRDGDRDLQSLHPSQGPQQAGTADTQQSTCYYPS